MTNGGMLSGRVVLVTGASRGLGRATARALAQAGATVVAVARSEAELRALAGEAAPGSVVPRVADVTDAAQVEQLFAFVEERFATLDALVNNAGFARSAPIEQTSVEDWDETMAVNLRAPFLCCKAALPLFRKQGRGQIVNVGSVAGRTAYVGGGSYASSKAALLMLTETLRLELQDAGIRVSAVSPGAMDTSLGGTVKRNPLDAAAVAQLIVQVIAAPEDVLVQEIVVRRSPPAAVPAVQGG